MMIDDDDDDEDDDDDADDDDVVLSARNVSVGNKEKKRTRANKNKNIMRSYHKGEKSNEGGETNCSGALFAVGWAAIDHG